MLTSDFIPFSRRHYLQASIATKLNRMENNFDPIDLSSYHDFLNMVDDCLPLIKTNKSELGFHWPYLRYYNTNLKQRMSCKAWFPYDRKDRW